MTYPIRPTILLGLAIFSMFFGAGNVIYPMDLGVHAGISPAAWIGFMIAAIGAPLIGLYAVMLADGKLHHVFTQNNIKGASLWILILILALGPIGATPRCVLLSYQALKAIIPSLSLIWYTVVLGLFLFYICLRQTKAFTFLGKWLSPILLGLLLYIAVLSLTQASAQSFDSIGFSHGLLQGYETMDLLASLLFAVSLWHFVQHLDINPQQSKKTYALAALIGAGLLCLVYLCLGIAASFQADRLALLSKDLYLNALALNTLGGLGAQLACSVIFLACVTTMVALLITCTENTLQLFAPSQKQDAFSWYRACLLIMIILTMIAANFGFEAISQGISLIVNITYPVFIMIALSHILAVKFNFRRINTLVYATCFGSIGVFISQYYGVLPHA